MWPPQADFLFAVWGKAVGHPDICCVSTCSYCVWRLPGARCPAPSSPWQPCRASAVPSAAENILSVRGGELVGALRTHSLAWLPLAAATVVGSSEGAGGLRGRAAPCGWQPCLGQKAACPERGGYSTMAAGLRAGGAARGLEDLVCPPKGLAFCLINGSGDGKK